MLGEYRWDYPAVMAPERTGDVGEEKAPRPKLGQRLQSRFLKPANPGAHDGWEIPTDVAELEEATRRTNDKERLVGAFAAPLAAAISFLVIGALISHDPTQFLKDGQVNPKYTSISLYHELLGVLLALSVAILGFAIWRKRLLLGIAMALYGLAIFNLRYWGFGIPFILGGAWLLVRAYRLGHGLKEATASPRAASITGRPRANKRYTPPVKR
jgi:hypothetical protein